MHPVEIALSLVEEGRFDEALRRLGSLCETYPQQPAIWLGIGLSHYHLGHCTQACHALERALAFKPDLDLARIYLARALVDLGELAAAVKIMEPLPEPAALYPEVANEYALACLGVQDFARAQVALEAALLRSPGDPFLLSNLAQVYERASRLDEARNLLARVANPDAQARLLIARLEAKIGGCQRALSLLNKLADEVAEDPESWSIKAQIEFERGRLHDRAGDYEHAFFAFARGNQFDREFFNAQIPLDDFEDGFPWLEDDARRDPQPLVTGQGESAADSPVFLVGFPRSGTTLMDQMLDAHPQLQVLEERPTLQPVIDRISSLKGGYPAALCDITVELAVELRQLYWAGVGRYIERRPRTILVDKQPLNMAQAQLIAHLFPNARWIYLLRHPCDVVLSCYMQRFHYTLATQGFWDLGLTARIYAETTRLWLEQRQRLGLQCIEVRYESLVDDPETQARALCSALGLSWHPQMLSTQAHARGRWVRTPSYDQVVEPVYRRAVGRWQRYRPWLKDIEAILAPAADRLAYVID